MCVCVCVCVCVHVSAKKAQFTSPRTTRAHKAALISVSVALIQTQAEAVSQRTRGYSVTRGYLFSSLSMRRQQRRYKFMLGKQKHTCVNNMPIHVVRGAKRPGLERATFRLQVRC